VSGLDFSKISDGSASDSATEPRRIFAALPSKDGKYGYARDVQSEVWQRWHERRDQRDLVIKMNTGGGKTVVGLIALKSCLNEGAGPAVYITPDIPLATQVAEEARQLGIEATDDPTDSRFRRGKAILIINVYKLFNGLSVFGVKGSARAPIELGAVLVDDAHACLATVESQFTLRIPDEHPACGELLALFDEDLKAQSAPTYRDLLEGGSSFAAMRVPFWAWADRRDEVLDLLHPHRDDDAFKFAWPLISEVLPLCDVAISADGVEIAPPCPPVEMITSFARAKRRLYLTATLADDSVLVTHFGASPETIRKPITPGAADDLGDRMILTPLQTFPDAEEEEVKRLLQVQGRERNVVVIVPSWARAAFWADVAEGTYNAEDLPGVLARLRNGHVGLVVFVNKYDGIDLPGDACRILVVDGLPEAMGALERLESLALLGSEALLTKQIQRIEQGMGRGVRSNDDFCVVMLMGRRLTERLHPASARLRFSPATRAQLELSDAIAEQLRDRAIDDMPEILDQCLLRDPGWVAASRGALDGLTFPDVVAVSKVAVAERQAFERAAEDSFAEAATEIQSAIHDTSDLQLRGLLKQRLAGYLHRVDPVDSQKAQKSAHRDNRAVMKPRQAISYLRLRGSATTQAKRASEHLVETYATPAELTLGIGALLDDLRPSPDPDAVDRFEEALHQLGYHLGLGSQRPERDVGAGPDVLWSLGELDFLVIECKSASQAGSISKVDAAQLSHSIDWFAESYDETCAATPLLIHPSRQLHSKASPRDGMRVLTFEKLRDLRAAVDTFAKALASSEIAHDPEAVNDRLGALQLNGAALTQKWTVKPRAHSS
jgi:hypothetical protein